MPPDVLVKNVTLEVVDLITKDKEIKSGNRVKLIEVIEAKVFPHFNFPGMTALAMGPSWNKSSPEQKTRMTEEFKTLLVRTYASALASYSTSANVWNFDVLSSHVTQGGSARLWVMATDSVGNQSAWFFELCIQIVEHLFVPKR